MSDPFLGEIRVFGFTYNPAGWAYCHGGTVPLSQYEALYAVIGDTYGGDNRTVIGLPRLNTYNSPGGYGYAAMGQGTGPGLTSRRIGAYQVGAEAVQLTYPQIPSHTHTVSTFLTTDITQYTDVPVAGCSLARTVNQYDFGAASNNMVAMAPSSISYTGGNQPHENMQPFVTMNFCICLDGEFPVRP